MRQALSKRSIHLRVKELSEQKGLSDLELAHFAHVDARVIRRMLNAQEAGSVYLHQLARVANALEVNVCDLFIKTKETNVKSAPQSEGSSPDNIR
ncbi:hypothetical protein KSF_092040 [Reticulibacter mediterranei]|uniref:Uncharacterized protein n=1 Tax=Reticulibacter mediterranei TaxID=2778369 RepID=A0A8J3J1N9_9CHLR|nr:hypothetical protein [Reticulibacter mediterranei]GHO99156.1 hypothetical protein KSF_092040 [Reticulibacter mediterranei]